MKTGYMLRGQGIGVVFDRVYENFPSKKDFEDVMRRELELHGFDPATGEPRERWVRVQTVEIDDGKPSAADTCKARLDEFVVGKLSDEDVAKIKKRKTGGSADALPFAVSGVANVSPAK